MLTKLKGVIRAIRSKLELARYDDFTISEYFRLQGARIGSDCRILIRSLGSEPYLISIGNHCTLSTNVSLLTHDGAASLFTREIPSIQGFGAVRILDNCFIGAGSMILPGITIGPNSIVGAASVVTKDVPPDSVVAGSPARHICSLVEYRAKTIKRWELQRPPGYLQDVPDGTVISAAALQAHKKSSSELLRRHLERLLMANG